MEGGCSIAGITKLNFLLLISLTDQLFIFKGGTVKSQSEENDLQRLGMIKYHLKMSGLLKLSDVQTGEEQSRGCGCSGGRTGYPCEHGGDEVFSSISRINCISVL